MAYEIIIKNETNDSARSAVAARKDNDTPQDTAQLSNEDISLAKGLVAYKKIKPWVNKIASFEISQVELRTGAREQQQKIEFGYQIANEVVGIAESAAMGFIVGNVPGAIIGTVLSIGQNLLSIAQRQNSINTRKSIENTSIQMNYIRAGTGGSRRTNE